MISTAKGAEHCATSIAQQLALTVEIANSRRAGLAATRRGEYCVILIDERLAEVDPAWMDLLAQNAGYALLMQLNFALATSTRIVHEVRAVLLRRERELELARQAAVKTLQNELKSSVTGLLLQSELALREPSVPVALASKLSGLVELAGAIGKQLQLGLPGCV
jgi:hypothetical protein